MYNYKPEYFNKILETGSITELPDSFTSPNPR